MLIIKVQIPFLILDRGLVLGLRTGDDVATGSPILKSRELVSALLVSVSLGIDARDNMVNVLLSAESIKSYKTVVWFGALHTEQNHATDVFASLPVSQSVCQFTSSPIMSS